MAEEFSPQEIAEAPIKLMLSIWLAGLIKNELAEQTKENENIFLLNSYASSWFAIGINAKDNTPFLGIQEGLNPWFFQIPWKKLVISPKRGYIYLLCGNNEMDDLVIGIKTRRKRMKILWQNDVPAAKKFCELRMIRIQNKEINISNLISHKITLEASEFGDDIAEHKPKEINEETSNITWSKGKGI